MAVWGIHMHMASDLDLRHFIIVEQAGLVNAASEE